MNSNYTRPTITEVQNTLDDFRPFRTGWICPRCGRSNSPDVHSCGCQHTYWPPQPATVPWWPQDQPFWGRPDITC